MERTNYRPNLAARSLATGKTGIVGLVIHEPASAVFSDPYFSAMLAGITDTLADEATGVMLWMSRKTEQETLASVLATSFVEGIICTATMVNDPVVDGLLASGVPTVLIGHRRHDDSANYVDIDNIGAAEDITEHLVDLGRRRIGHITGLRGTVSGDDRLIGYHRAMDKAGLSDRFVVDGDYTEEGGYAAALELLDMNVDAIFAGSDSTARGIYTAARERGIKIPDEVAVAGFDDLSFSAEMDPPLTTVRQNIPAQGRIAALTLLKILDRSPDAAKRVILPTELVIRQSTLGGGAGWA